jgi:hypothetical protein
MGLVDESGRLNSRALRVRVMRIAGGYSPAVRWWRRWRPKWLWRHTSAFGQITTRYVAEHGLEVRRGPFAGMRYAHQMIAHAGYVTSKLIGCYEAELHDAILKAVQWDPDLVLNVGSGDGYYTVGLARALPAARSIGYETDARERRAAELLAKTNGASVIFAGTCSTDTLQMHSTYSRPLLIMDVEGFESELLDPNASPMLRQAMIIVEVHDSEPGGPIARALLQDFSASHEIEQVGTQCRTIADYDELASWPAQKARIALSEGRPREGLWFVMSPRADIVYR